jgi:hypothetical protein
MFVFFLFNIFINTSELIQVQHVEQHLKCVTLNEMLNVGGQLL